jgi:hypothetical protein
MKVLIQVALVFNNILCGPSGYQGEIIVQQTKNHVKQPKNCQFFQTNLCNATLMSC